MEHDGSGDGSDIFWPGYVDAVTNLVLNLLFVLVIMIIAVFMFALALSRHTDEKTASATVENSTKNNNSAEIIKEKDSQIEALQKALQSVKSQAKVENKASTPQKVVTVQTPINPPEKQLEQASNTGGAVIVNFQQEAVTLSATEAETVRNALKAIASSGSAHVQVSVPKGFSEAKRVAFYRAMAVRNQLISLKVPADKIEVSVSEGARSADNSKVVVTLK